MTLGSLYRMSIASRMVLAALLLVILMLPLAGGLLFWNVRATVNTAFNERLEALLNVVIAGVYYDPAQGRLDMERELGDPRFQRVFSGWYWQVRGEGGRVLTSRSLWDQRLPGAETLPGLTFNDVVGPREEPLRATRRQVRLPMLGEPLEVVVAADLSEVDQQVARFGHLLSISLLAFGGLLLLVIWFQIRWGLAPLRRLERNLRAVEEGASAHLETTFPEELARLAQAINTVLERDRRLIESGRAAAGNLAHALKTPLSVLGALAERLPTDTREAIELELDRLGSAVRHHLARASAVGPAPLGRALNVKLALAPVVDGVRRLAGRRGLRFEAREDASASLKADSQDLQEIVGNLLENAVTWAGTSVTLDYKQRRQEICITVADDGPGMSDQEARQAMNRGAKLDEQRSGSGLGLSIVRDLVRLYGGVLTLERSGQGGLQACVRLPLGESPSVKAPGSW